MSLSRVASTPLHLRIAPMEGVSGGASRAPTVPHAIYSGASGAGFSEEASIPAHLQHVPTIESDVATVPAQIAAYHTTPQKQDYSIGSMINEYKILKQLGRGSYGIVYSVENTNTHETYAMKVATIFPHGVENGLSQDVLRETVMLRQNDHPNVLSAVDIFTNATKTNINIIMPLADSDLHTWIRSKKRSLSPEDIRMAKSYIYQLYCGLDYLAKKHIIHGDIKPGNVLIFGNTIKIADFGISMFCAKEECLLSHGIGTLIYRAPETLTRANTNLVSSKFDIWSAGCIVYEIAAGSPLFTYTTPGDILKHATNNTVRAVHSNVISDVLGEEFEDAFISSMEINPSSRPTAVGILDMIASRGVCKRIDVEEKAAGISPKHSTIRGLVMDKMFTIGTVMFPEYREFWLVGTNVLDAYLAHSELTVRDRSDPNDPIVIELSVACALITVGLIVDTRHRRHPELVNEMVTAFSNPAIAIPVVDASSVASDELFILERINFAIDYPSPFVVEVVRDESLTFDSERMTQLYDYVLHVNDADAVTQIHVVE
uniref:Protein kinase domain-containing protein n=1 Tax=viral metagenome TaxID=1070528 RepID=A0A6C0LXS6_9ZZZZ